MSAREQAIADPQAPVFVGREKEIEQVSRLLTDDTCHLLTLVGGGGVGKTRLALRVMYQMRDYFADGIRFLDVQACQTTADLIAAIADSVGITLSGQEQPAEQLLRFLQDKRMLIALDNFERILNASHFLSRIIARTPTVKLLVTSREVLKLSEEHRCVIQGLEVPEESGLRQDSMACASVRLFVERARRVRQDFSLDAEWADVVRICQLVEGIPLAIELAASWVSALRCATIAAEIQHNLTFLQSHLRDIPERHRSIETVFEQSWQRLSEEERGMFMRLSIFRGGFGREAAQAVAGTSLPILSELLDKSLLRFEEHGRYIMHELLRQYADAKLAQVDPEAVTVIRARYTSYYLAFLAERRDDVVGGRQKEAAAEVAIELENIRAAWKWAVAEMRIDEIVEAAFTVFSFYQFNSRYLEGARMLDLAARRLSDDMLTARPRAMLVLTCLGWFYIRLGRFDEAQRLFARAQAVYHLLDHPADMPYAFDPSVGLGLLASMRGDYHEAQAQVEQALRTSEQHAQLLNQESAHYVLAGILSAQGQYEAAQRHARAGYGAAHTLGARWFMAYCLNELGSATAALGDYASATQYYEASYALRDEFDDAEGMALALIRLGEVALIQRDVVKAQRHFADSLALYRRIDDQGGLATALHELGRTAIARGDAETARQTLQGALQRASDIQFVPLVLNIIVSVGEFALKWRPSADVGAWLDFVCQHPSADDHLKARAAQTWAQFDGEANRPLREPNSWTLPQIVAELQLELALGAKQARRDNQRQAAPSLEPFTDQEQKVLQLLAQGLTNEEIAQALTVVVGTVKTHNHHIYAKLGVDNRTQAVVRARDLHLI